MFLAALGIVLTKQRSTDSLLFLPETRKNKFNIAFILLDVRSQPMSLSSTHIVDQTFNLAEQIIIFNHRLNTNSEISAQF